MTQPWTKDNTLFFIGLIRKRPVIWDTSLVDYKSKTIRDAALKEVSKLMGISAKEVTFKWYSLRGQYFRELKRLKVKTDILKYTGEDDEESLPKSTWYAFKEMESLTEHKESHAQDSFLIKEETTSTTHTPSSPSSTLPSPTSTPPPVLPTTSGIPQNKRNNSSYSLSKVIRNIGRDSKSIDTNDDISAFGLYISAQLRKFNPHLQSKAKYEINKILFTIEMEQLKQTTHFSTETSYLCDTPESFPDPLQSTNT